MNGFDQAGLAMLQSHAALSLGRVIFLVAIVVTFCALFIGFYVWMRRPGFGQGITDRPPLTLPDRQTGTTSD